MSDSDDTDVLLLIPPDFFFVAPSPSPASSPISVSPPSPINSSLRRRKRITFTERQAVNSLKEITSQLKLIEERLSAVESQRSGSMDDDNSCVWYDLESYEEDNSVHQPRRSRDNYRQSINVKELLNASRKDASSRNRPQDSSLTQSWEPSSLKHSYSQTAKHFIHKRNKASRDLSQEDIDSADEALRERRATSLPPTPSRNLYLSTASHRNKGMEASTRSPSLGRANFETKSLRSDVGPEQFQRREFDDSFDKCREGRSTEFSRETAKKATQVNQREGASMKSSNQAPDDSHSVHSNSLDGTLGMADLIPSLSALGLSGSYAVPTSLEETKATDSSIDGGFTLSQVEKLLQDMQKTQAEMERSMRGMKNLRKDKKEDGKIVSNPGDRDISPRKETKICREPQISETDKSNTESEESGMDHGQGNNLDQNSKGDVQGFPAKSSKVPDSLSVENRNGYDCRWRGSKDVEGNHVDGKCYPIYKSKSDESLSGKDKRPTEVSKNKCVGTESADDYFIRRPLSPTRTSYLGDTLGSVPDLGLGVREMFAKPPEKGQNTLKVPSKGSEKLKDSVKEPPFVKRKMYLVENEENDTKTGNNKSVPPAGNNKCVGTESEDEGCITGSKLAQSHISGLGDTLGSVPDLGLGVRELFAKPPEKHHVTMKDPTKGSREPQDPIEEPLITKKKMYVVEGENDAKTMKSNSVSFSENHKCIGTQSDDDSCTTGGKLSSTHISNQGDTLGSVPDLGLGVRELFAKTPEKHRDPVEHPSKGSENHKNAVKEPPCVKKKTWLLGSGSTCAQTMADNLVPNGKRMSDLPPYSSERQEKLREELIGWNEAINAEESANLGRKLQKNEVIAPVVVVGGDGPKKIRRDVSIGWDGGKEGHRVGRRYICRGDAEENEDIAEREEADVRKRRVHVDREARDRVKYGQGSLDSRKDKYARYRDSGFGDGDRSSFEAIRQMHAQKLFQTSGAWALPSDIDITAGPEVIISLRRKLEEEKFRREHCERVIEEVGRRALEAQERLAVCEGMSKAKDVAIGKFHDAWEEAVAGWKKEGEACKELEKEIDRYRKRMNEELTFREKRLKQLEKEIVELAEESHFLREELRKGQRETADVTARLSTMLETATKEVASCRRDAEDALMRESRAREEASKACEASREAKERMNEAVKKADVLEAEKEIMKQELEAQREKLKDLISRIATLEKQQADAEIAADRATKSEKLLLENLTMAQKEWEKEKVKLKDFYQSQVEELVKTKVNEFQNQLDAVEQSLRKEAETREEDAKKLGEERLRMLNEKHSQEVNLLEQKHAEEISLWNLRLKRVMEELDSLKQEVSKHNSQKAQLAKGLHSLMQAQLRQGLRLIASGGEVDQDPVLSPPKKMEKPTLESSWREIMSSLNVHDKADVLPEKEYHSKRYLDHSREKRLHSKERIDNEPLLSSQNKTTELPNSELKKYIHMLLGQEPGKPLGNQDISSESDGDYEKQVLDSKSKQYLMKQMSKFGIGGQEPRIDSRDKRRSRKERTKVAEKEDACKLTRDEPAPVWSSVGLKFDHLTSEPGGSEHHDIHENRRNRKPPWK